jgi:hypothetical protein
MTSLRPGNSRVPPELGHVRLPAAAAGIWPANMPCTRTNTCDFRRAALLAGSGTYHPLSATYHPLR